MGGKGSSGPSQQEINQAAYNAGAAGDKWSVITHDIPYGHDQALDAWKQGQASMRPPPMPAFGGFEMPEFEAPDYGAMQSQQQASFEAQQAEQQRRMEEMEAERRRIEGENRRDALYSDYLDAAGVATDFINSQIASEQSNAALLGIDYDITDEQKSARISNYFAGIWGEGQQNQLEALMSEWGNPQGFEGFTIERGDADLAEGGPEGEEDQVAVGEGLRPRTVLEDEEQVLGGTTAILGT